MRILDETGKEIFEPDLDKGYIKTETIVLAHHDAVPYRPAVMGQEVVWEDPDNPDNKVCKTVEVSPVQWPRAAWDETEKIQRYVKYTDAELAERAEQKAAAEEAEREAEKLAVEQAEKQAEREAYVDSLPSVVDGLFEALATNQERFDMIEDALIEVAALIGE